MYTNIFTDTDSDIDTGTREKQRSRVKWRGVPKGYKGWYKYGCITINQPYTKSHPNLNPDPASKQYAMRRSFRNTHAAMLQLCFYLPALQ